MLSRDECFTVALTHEKPLGPAPLLGASGELAWGWAGRDPAVGLGWPCGLAEGTFQLPLAHPALPYLPWGCFWPATCATLPTVFPEETEYSCSFALLLCSGGEKKVFFFLVQSIQDAHLCTCTCKHTYTPRESSSIYGLIDFYPVICSETLRAGGRHVQI